MTTVLGCTTWPSFGRGLAMFLIIWALRPNQNSTKIIGAILVTTVALLGGFESMNDGTYQFLFSDPSQLYYHWKNESFALVLGGLIGLITVSIVEKKIFSD